MTRHLEGENTHYRFPWVDTIDGERLRIELADAGVVVDRSQVTYDPLGNELVVVLSFDDKGKQEAKIAKVVKKHEGTEAKDYVALVAFTDAVRGVAERMAEGGEVSHEERDIVTGVLVSRLI